MKEILRLIAVLTLFGAVAGLMLAVTNKVTADPIAAAASKTIMEAMSKVLPPFDNQPDKSIAVFTENGGKWEFFVARKAGQFAGAAVISSSGRGYGGEIKLMLGLDASGTVKDIQIIEQHETPGLGSKIAEAPFRTQFAGKPLAETTWRVKKDGGHVDAVTGATISSRAVAEAIRKAAEAYQKHAEAIRATGG